MFKFTPSCLASSISAKSTQLGVNKIRLASKPAFKPNLTYHALVTLSNQNGKLIAAPIDISTSGDLVGLAKTEAILTLPADREQFGIEETFPVLEV